MKTQLDYSLFKQLCLSMAEKIREYKPDELVAVMRGGMTAAHIISKTLNIPCGAYFPNGPTKLVLTTLESKRIVFIEDLIAKGRTLENIRVTMSYQPREWKIAPVLIDSNYIKLYHFDEQYKRLCNRILTYGMITPHWMVMPYEQNEMMVEGDHGLFRDKTDQYGKKVI
jgi:hypoxanthine phosphoribosyltransferase